MLWYGTLMPRIHFYLPAETILELAPGFGRMTRYLREHCTYLIGVDLSPKCIDHCKKRFADDHNLKFYRNNGMSLEMIQDDSIDFVFSFDSFVHVERPEISMYLKQISKKLKKEGVCFIHHSNLGEYADYFSEISKVSDNSAVNNLFKQRTIDVDSHWRATSMTAGIFRQEAESANLSIICQEKINWCTTPSHCIDCFSVCMRADSQMKSSVKLIRNKRFMEEMNHWKEINEAYSVKPK
jgi:2-polyprenyl-3-methyl-5-hydroxy-6-metoxy-1,4-benzoquinol methylase